MVMSFQIHALPESLFAPLFAMSDEELGVRCARRVVVDGPGFPCRVSLEDAAVGETVILTNYEHQPEASPFRASHAVYVRDGVKSAAPVVGAVPKAIRSRLISVRGFDDAHDIAAADVVEGRALGDAIEAMFADPKVRYLHLHYAKPGCYAARVTRAERP
jgi:hypothetical protein